MDAREDQKRAAAQAAADLVPEGSRVGLGSGSTVAHFLAALARRKLELRCVSTSPATEETARTLGLAVQPFDLLERLDIAVDGADQVDDDLWLVKGGGGAHTREKVVAASSDRFVVIVSSDKLVERVRPPIPLEVLRFGLTATLRRLGELGPAAVREGAAPTPDGNLLVDFLGEFGDPDALGDALASVPGVVEHGLFSRDLVTEVLVGRPDGSVERLTRR